MGLILKYTEGLPEMQEVGLSQINLTIVLFIYLFIFYVIEQNKNISYENAIVLLF